MLVGINGRGVEREEGIQLTHHHSMKTTLACLITVFFAQLFGGAVIPQSANAQNISERPGACWTRGATNPKGNDQSAKWADAQYQLRRNLRRDRNLRLHRVTGYCTGHTQGFKLRTSKHATNIKPGTKSSNTPQLTRGGYGACWTRGATNPKGKNQSAKWADAQSQLRANFRRNNRLEAILVTGYCKNHTKGFKLRTPDIAVNRQPGTSPQNQAGSYLNDQRFICATAPFSCEACLTRREWLSLLLKWGSSGEKVTMKIPNYGTSTKTIRTWIPILKNNSFSSAKTSRFRVPIRACGR